MTIATTYEVSENIKEFLQEKIPEMMIALKEENPEYVLPEVREYKIGYVDVFSQSFYPSILIGCGKTKPEEKFSDMFEIEVVFTHKNGNKTQLIKEGYLYSDLLYFLFRNYHRLNNKTLNVTVVEREHFEGDEIFISSIVLNVEVEKGEYGK